jgi:hypothetical protein
MKESTVCAFSDTHGKHSRLSPPEQADILVFAGDACEVGNARELWDFFKWFEGQPARHKLFVPGNHDLLFDTHPDIIDALIPQGITYIEEGEITLDGVRFYVLPARPYLCMTASCCPVALMYWSRTERRKERWTKTAHGGVRCCGKRSNNPNRRCISSGMPINVAGNGSPSATPRATMWRSIIGCLRNRGGV